MQLTFEKEWIPEVAKMYSTGTPFPNVVIDHFFDTAYLKQVCAFLPNPNLALEKNVQTTKHKISYGFNDFTKLNLDLSAFILWFNTPEFLEILEGITGIEGLIPDPYYYGGGLHQVRNRRFFKDPR